MACISLAMLSPGREKEDLDDTIKQLQALIQQEARLNSPSPLWESPCISRCCHLTEKLSEQDTGHEGQRGQGSGRPQSHLGGGMARLTRGMVTAMSTLISGLMQVPSR